MCDFEFTLRLEETDIQFTVETWLPIYDRQSSIVPKTRRIVTLGNGRKFALLPEDAEDLYHLIGSGSEEEIFYFVYGLADKRLGEKNEL